MQVRRQAPPRRHEGARATTSDVWHDIEEVKKVVDGNGVIKCLSCQCVMSFRLCFWVSELSILIDFMFMWLCDFWSTGPWTCAPVRASNIDENTSLIVLYFSLQYWNYDFLIHMYQGLIYSLCCLQMELCLHIGNKKITCYFSATIVNGQNSQNVYTILITLCST